MILIAFIACLFTTPKTNNQHVHAQVEVVDSEIEIVFVQGE